MKLRFLFIERTRSSYLAEGVRDFLKRISNYLPAEEILIKGLKARDDKAEAITTEETKRLLASVGPDDVFVHLDPGGRQLTSEELASWLKERMDGGTRTISFGLGGPLGLTMEAARRADLRLCLSRMTFTHEMSRLILLEQIYRSLRIIAGHPYHKQPRRIHRTLWSDHTGSPHQIIGIAARTAPVN